MNSIRLLFMSLLISLNRAVVRLMKCSLGGAHAAVNTRATKLEVTLTGSSLPRFHTLVPSKASI